MKRAKIFSLTLAAALLLTACGTTPPPAETAPATEPPAKTRTVVESFTSEIFLGGMTLTVENQYTYNELGLLRETVARNNGMESRSTFEHDEMGEVIRETAVANGMTTVTESENTYDEAGNLIKKIDTVTADGVVTDIREYNYDEEHRHTLVTFQIFGENPVTITTRYEYDGHGNQTAEYQETNGIETIVLTEYGYDDQGRICTAIKKNGNGEVTGTVCYSYDENTSTLTALGPDNAPASTVVNTYNEEGQLILSETRNGDTLTQRTTYTYITVPAFK